MISHPLGLQMNRGKIGDKQSDISEDDNQIVERIRKEFEEFLERKYEILPQKTQKLIKEVLAMNPNLKS